MIRFTTGAESFRVAEGRVFDAPVHRLKPGCRKASTPATQDVPAEGAFDGLIGEFGHDWPVSDNDPDAAMVARLLTLVLVP